MLFCSSKWNLFCNVCDSSKVKDWLPGKRDYFFSSLWKTSTKHGPSNQDDEDKNLVCVTIREVRQWVGLNPARSMMHTCARFCCSLEKQLCKYRFANNSTKWQKKVLITKNVSDLFSQPQSDEIMAMLKMKAWCNHPGLFGFFFRNIIFLHIFDF